MTQLLSLHCRLKPRPLALLACLLALTCSWACDDDDDEYFLVPSEGSIVFYNECSEEASVRIYVNGQFKCEDAFGSDSGCLVEVPSGVNTYYVEGSAYVWGRPSEPLFLEVDPFQTVEQRLACEGTRSVETVVAESR